MHAKLVVTLLGTLTRQTRLSATPIESALQAT